MKKGWTILPRGQTLERKQLSKPTKGVKQDVSHNISQTHTHPIKAIEEDSLSSRTIAFPPPAKKQFSTLKKKIIKDRKEKIALMVLSKDINKESIIMEEEDRVLFIPEWTMGELNTTSEQNKEELFKNQITDVLRSLPQVSKVQGIFVTFSSTICTTCSVFAVCSTGIECQEIVELWKTAKRIVNDDVVIHKINYAHFINVCCVHSYQEKNTVVALVWSKYLGITASSTLSQKDIEENIQHALLPYEVGDIVYHHHHHRYPSSSTLQLMEVPSMAHSFALPSSSLRLSEDLSIYHWIPIQHLYHLNEKEENQKCQIVVSNMIANEDLNNEDEYEEVLNDVRDDLNEYTEMDSGLCIQVCRKQHDIAFGTIRTEVVLTFSCVENAILALHSLDGKTYGGHIITTRWLRTAPLMIVSNMFLVEELLEEDEREDILESVIDFLHVGNSIRNVHVQFPDMEFGLFGLQAGDILIEYTSKSESLIALEKLHSKQYGGRPLHLRLLSNGHLNKVFSTTTKGAMKTQVPFPIMREYVDQNSSSTFSTGIFELLGRLMALQERARHRDPNKAKKVRRLVFGLHEVKRGVKAGRVIFLIVSYNIEKSSTNGSLDDQVTEIITLAKVASIPIVYALSKRRLGKALGKTIKVSCVGIVRYDGANQEFKTLLRLCHEKEKE